MGIKKYIVYILFMALPVFLLGFIIKLSNSENFFCGVFVVPLYLTMVMKLFKVNNKIKKNWVSILSFLFSIFIMMTFYDITFNGGMWAVSLGLRPNMTLDPGTRIIAIALSLIVFYIANVLVAITSEYFEKKQLIK